MYFTVIINNNNNKILFVITFITDGLLVHGFNQMKCNNHPKTYIWPNKMYLFNDALNTF